MSSEPVACLLLALEVLDSVCGAGTDSRRSRSEA